MKTYVMAFLIIGLLFVSACTQVVVDDTPEVISKEPIYDNNEQDPEDVKVVEKPIEKRLPLPVMDMTAEQRYKGESGGLYGNGLNIPPDAHRSAALLQVGKIQPLDMDGMPSDLGKIGFIVLGDTNAKLAFDTFMSYADSDEEVNKRIIFVNGAQKGRDAYQWYANPSYFAFARLSAEDLGLSNNQVQVAWIYFSNAKPIGEFPYDADKLQKYLYDIIPELKVEYENLQIVYISSEVYSGYVTVPETIAEPYAYEYAFAIKWLINDQINGNLELNYDPAKRQVKSPIILWGPYLWANGDNPRSDGLVWERTDFEADGITLSDSGAVKVAQMLTDFFKTSDTTKNWFLKSTK